MSEFIPGEPIKLFSSCPSLDWISNHSFYVGWSDFYDSMGQLSSIILISCYQPYIVVIATCHPRQSVHQLLKSKVEGLAETLQIDANMGRFNPIICESVVASIAN